LLLTNFKATANPELLQMHCFSGASAGEGTGHQLAREEVEAVQRGHMHHVWMGRDDGLVWVSVLDTAWVEGASWAVIAAAACMSLCCTPQHAAGLVYVCVEWCSTHGRRSALRFRLL